MRPTKSVPGEKGLDFLTPLCIGNLSLPEKNYELLIFPSEFFNFWYLPGDIAQTVFGPWLTSVSFKTFTDYK